MKHYVVTLEIVTDDECIFNILGVAHTLEEAKAIFAQEIDNAREFAMDCDWEIDADNDTEFSAFQDGYYLQSHINLYIREVD